MEFPFTWATYSPTGLLGPLLLFVEPDSLQGWTLLRVMERKGLEWHTF